MSCFVAQEAGSFLTSAVTISCSSKAQAARRQLEQCHVVFFVSCSSGWYSCRKDLCFCVSGLVMARGAANSGPEGSALAWATTWSTGRIATACATRSALVTATAASTRRTSWLPSSGAGLRPSRASNCGSSVASTC